MRAMIFSAGLGTRFKPWTDAHPKALAIVNGKSLLQRNIEYLQKAGITEVIVNVHHFADQIKEAVRTKKGWGSTIYLSDETDVVLETGGGLVKAKELFKKEEDFLTINVDILTDLNLEALIASHRRNKPLVTLAVSQRKSSRCFLFDGQDRLTGWKNLQTNEERISVPTEPVFPKAFSGISVFSYEFFEVNRLSGKFSLVDAYLQLAATHKILGYEHPGSKWVDVGKPESVKVAEALFGV